MFKQSFSIDSKCAQLYWKRSKVHKAMHEYHAAIDDLECFLEHHPIKAKGWIDGEAFALKGDLFYKVGEYSKALADYSVVINSIKKSFSQSAFEHSHALHNLLEKRGKCSEALQEEAKAKADFRKATKAKKEMEQKWW